MGIKWNGMYESTFISGIISTKNSWVNLRSLHWDSKQRKKGLSWMTISTLWKSRKLSTLEERSFKKLKKFNFDPKHSTTKNHWKKIKMFQEIKKNIMYWLNASPETRTRLVRVGSGHFTPKPATLKVNTGRILLYPAPENKKLTRIELRPVQQQI